MNHSNSYLYCLIYCLSLVAGMFSFLSIHAQSPSPTFLPADYLPQVGEIYPGDRLDQPSVNLISNAPFGANQTWDFSSVTSVAADTAFIVAVSATPFSSLFPTASYCEFHSLDSSYSYYVPGSANLQLVGRVSGNGQRDNYSNSLIRFNFPIAHMDFFSDFAIGQRTASGTSRPINSNLTVVADGYGTLVLPSGTYPDVLRLRSDETLVDSTANGPVTTEILSYHYLIIGNNHPLVIYTATTTNGVTTSRAEYFPPSSLVGLDAPQPQTPLTVYPSPFRDQLTLQFDASPSETYRVQLHDLRGKIVHQKAFPNAPSGPQRFQLQWGAALPAGVYLLTLSGTDRILARKKVIRMDR